MAPDPVGRPVAVDDFRHHEWLHPPGAATVVARHFGNRRIRPLNLPQALDQGRALASARTPYRPCPRRRELAGPIMVDPERSSSLWSADLATTWPAPSSMSKGGVR